MLSRTLIIKTSALKPVEKLVRKSFLFRPLVRRFIAGDNLEQAMTAVQALLERGFSVTLDNLGENTKTEAEALKAKSTYIQMLDRIGCQCRGEDGGQGKGQDKGKDGGEDKGGSAIKVKGRGLHDSESLPKPSPKPLLEALPPSSLLPSPGSNVERCNISIKLTQCGLDLGTEYAERNYRDVLQAAQQHHNFVRVDMEASAYTARTMEIMERVLPDFSNTGTVLQSYMLRTDDDLQRLIELKSRVRLVKGAYLEPASVAYQDKKDVDAAYLRQAKRLLTEAPYPAIATHDERIVKELNAYVAERGIDKSGFEYQMLFGIRRDLQDRLKNDGYNVRVYVPFGDSWYPYFTRRLAERPANAFFILRSLFKG